MYTDWWHGIFRVERNWPTLAIFFVEVVMDFPITDLMDQGACYCVLVDLLHPKGLACPRCRRADGFRIHRRNRAPVLDYRCGHCRRVFNAFTGTVFQKTPRRPSELILILRGFAQGVPTAQLARELGINRPHLLGMRHKLQANAQAHLDRTSLPDAAVEADEMYKNAGEKRRSTPRPGRPAAASRQHEARARHLGHGPATAVRGGGSPQ